MYADKVKFVDFLGVEKEVVCYFNYDEHEILTMEAGQTESVSEHLSNILGSKNKQEIMDTFSEFVLNAYGELTEDGNVLMKTPEIRQRFKCSRAYNAIIMKFMTNPDTYASKFINSVMPDMKKLSETLESAKDKVPKEALQVYGG